MRQLVRLSCDPLEHLLERRLHFPGCTGINPSAPGLVLALALALVVEDGLAAGPGPLPSAEVGGPWWV
jgi:hypothetical protein